MIAEAADQRTAVAGIDIEAPRCQHAFFREEDLAVGEIDFLEREQLPGRVGQAVEVVQQAARRRHHQLAVGGARDRALDRGPGAVALVEPVEEFGEGLEGLADDADVDFGHPRHHLARQRGQHAAAEHDRRLGADFARDLDDALDRGVGGGDATEGDRVPIIGLKNGADRFFATAPGILVVDLHEMAALYRDGGQQRDAVGHVPRHILFADHRIDEQDLGQATL